MTMELGVSEIENGSNEIGKDDLQREVKMLRRENHALKLEIEALKQEQDVFTIGNKRVKLTNGGYINYQPEDRVDSREDGAAGVENVSLQIPSGAHAMDNGVQSVENGDATSGHETLGLDLLSFTFGAVESDPDKPILVDATDPSRFLTSSMARTMVRKVIAGLKAQGLESGDCVCINSFNDIYYPIIYLAIVGAGGLFTGSNPSYTSLELNHHIRTSQAKFLITEPSMLQTTLKSAKDCEVPKSRVFVFDAVDHSPYEGQKSWTELLTYGEADWVRFNDTKQAKSTIATLSFTSGTTGLPKAAMISHLYSVSQVNTVKGNQTPYDVSRLVCIPAFHQFAVPLISGTAIRYQQTAYIMRRFDMKIYLESLHRYQVTELTMVPTMMIAIMLSPLMKKEQLQSARSVIVGGSPLRSSTQADFQALLHPDARVTQVWGMTETGWTTVFSWPEVDNTGSVGRLTPGLVSKLVAEDGSVITEDNMEGELCVKGDAIMNGYLDNPAATARAFDNEGFLKSGDIAYCDQGKWYIVDRKKDLIKVHGFQVAPAELEAVLLTHPQVINVAVIGIPIKDGTGDVPAAFVVKKPRASVGTYVSNGEDEENEVSAEELKAYLRARLAKYKALETVTFVEDIPRTPSGKAMKYKLRALHSAAMEA